MRRPTHTTVVAYLALFAALATGGAFAASELSRDSVKKKHIAKNAVRSAEIKNGTVGAKEMDQLPGGFMENPVLGPYIGRGDADVTYQFGQFYPPSAFDQGAGTFTAPVGGTYSLSFEVSWTGESAISTTASIIKNGSDTLFDNSGLFIPGSGQRVDGTTQLQKGDVVKVHLNYTVQNVEAGPVNGEDAQLTVQYEGG